MEFPEIFLDPQEVHVWPAQLTASRAAQQDCFHSLSPDERQRASRFRFDHLQVAFTLTRGTLRALLGRYLGLAPTQIRFEYAERGKPRVASPPSSLMFNLSHSGQLAVFAFSHHRELGIDVELIRHVDEQESIVQRFFSPGECHDWFSLPPEQRDAAFFRCWTRKEAYIKAVGDGLQLPLDSFRVTLLPGEPAALLSASDPAAIHRWAFHHFEPAEGYAGALAVNGRGHRVRLQPCMPVDALLELIQKPGPFPPPEHD